MDNATYNDEINDIIAGDSGEGPYTFKIAQYNKSGNCIFNAWALGLELHTVFALVDHALQEHPLAEFEVAYFDETYEGCVLISKAEYKSIEYWRE